MSLTIRPLFVVGLLPDAPGPGNTDHTVTRPFTIIDGTVEATATQAGGTQQILRQALGAGGFNATTDAVACAVDTALTGVGNITALQRTFNATDVLRLALAGAITDGRFSAYATMNPIPGGA